MRRGLRFEKTDGGYAVTGIGGYAGADLIIPSEHKGEPVVRIAERAFRDCVSVRSVTVPESIEEIGEDAFEGCYRLIEVRNLSRLRMERRDSGFGKVARHAENVYTDEKDAGRVFVTEGGLEFYSYTEKYGGNLDPSDRYFLVGYRGSESDLRLPDRIEGHDYDIYGCAFRGCGFLKSVNIPFGTTDVFQDAFYKCTSIERVYVSSLSDWLGLTFWNAAANPLHCGAELYAGGEKVVDLVVPDGAGGVKDYAFSGCSSLKSVRIGDGDVWVGDDAFGGCDNLESVSFGKDLEEIHKYAFSLCEKLREIDLPDGLASIGERAFNKCFGLRSVTVPRIIDSIGPCAFQETSHDFRIYFGGNEYEWNDVEGSDDADGRVLLYSENPAGKGYWHRDGNGNPKEW